MNLDVTYHTSPFFPVIISARARKTLGADESTDVGELIFREKNRPPHVVDDTKIPSPLIA